jgi:3-oxoacyl-(acyl-carrier-protein) synthase
MAEDLMQNEALNYCLVVGAEEVDWLLCDAYRKWRLLRRAPPIEPFREPPKGMILSEGAGAVVLAREGGIRIEKVAAGENYLRRERAAEILSAVFTELGTNETDIVIGSANGTFVDFAERDAVLTTLTKALFYSMKPALGESVGASAFWQIIVAAQVLQTGEVPPQLHAASQGALQFSTGQTIGPAIQRATVSTCGLNQQVGGVRLSMGVDGDNPAGRSI